MANDSTRGKRPKRSEPAPDKHPNPQKAYKNLDFLNSPAARSIRVQCELTEPAIRFKKHRVQNTISIFGSARIPSAEEAAIRLAKIEEETKGLNTLTPSQQMALDLARGFSRGSRYYEDTRRLAYELTRWSMETIDKPKNRFYVCSGGGPGIMEAVNRGAYEAGGKSVSLGISLPFEQHLNRYSEDELSFEFHYFFIRKYWFFYLAKALVCCPGGFGTMDELFEMLTLLQTHKAKKYVPVVLYGKQFWEELINFDTLVKWGVISPGDLNLFKICDSVEEARDYLIQELTNHYL